jgi:alpha-tubulin suppressor-like RCC1 family protein
MKGEHCVVSFGTGAFGRLGNGPIDKLVPEPVQGPLTGQEIACVSAGLYHSAVVTKNGGVYMFGSNATGCLASNDDPSSQGPKLIQSLPPRFQVVQAACGGDLLGAHTLAVTAQGRLYAWGNARACGLGPAGELNIISEPTLVKDFVREDSNGREIVCVERISFVAAGGSCSAVITAEGQLYTFGITAGGRLGHERKIKSGPTVQFRPKRVDALLGETIVTVSVGNAHMLCVTRRGALFAWGDNSKGQLGLGDFVDRFKPEKISHPKNAAWAPILAAGEGHSLAVDVNGKLYSWGGSGGPMLGRAFNSPISTDSSERERVLCVSFQIPDVRTDFTVPIEVTALSDHRIVRVAAGARHSVAVTSEGLVFTFGSRDQLGIQGHVNLVSVPRLMAPSAALPLVGPAAISAGSFHNLVVTGSVAESPVFKFLADSLDRVGGSIPSTDSFLKTRDGKRIWLNSTVLKQMVSSVGWNAFLKPQIELVASSPPTSPKQSVPLSRIADAFNDPSDEEQRVMEEYDRIDRIFEEWTDGDKHEEIPEIPSDCKFENLSFDEGVRFFRFLLTEQLPGNLSDDGSLSSDSALHLLLRLSICAYFERGIALVKQRLKRIARDNSFSTENVPPPKALSIMDDMYRDRDQLTKFGVVKFVCGKPIYRNTILHESDLVVSVHSFVVEAMCPNVKLDSHNRTVQAQNVPVDVMDELVYFWYHFHLNENELNAEMELSHLIGDSKGSDQKRAIEFWAVVAKTAANWGSKFAAAAALDKLVDSGTDDSWELILENVNDIKGNKQVRESVLNVGVSGLVRTVMSHESFNLASGYIVQPSELPAVVDRILNEEQIEHEEVRQRVHKRVGLHCSTARKIRAKLEYFQTLNLDPISPNFDEKSSVFSKIKNHGKSLFVSLRNEPSMAATARDLIIIALLVAGIAFAYNLTSLSATETRIGRLLAKHDFAAKAVVVLVNFLFITIALFFLVKSPTKLKTQ